MSAIINEGRISIKADWSRSVGVSKETLYEQRCQPANISACLSSPRATQKTLTLSSSARRNLVRTITKKQLQGALGMWAAMEMQPNTNNDTNDGSSHSRSP